MVFSSVAGLGSLHPLLALAFEARSAGHDILVATSEERRDMIERLDFAFAPAGSNPRAEMIKRHPEIPVPPIDDETLRLVRHHMFAGVYTEMMLPGLLEACESWRPDVVVRGHLAHAPQLVAEKLGIPYATIEEAAAGELDANEAMFAEALAAWREELGLAPDPILASLRRHLWLVPFPASIRHPDATFGPTARRLQPLIFNETSSEPEPAWLASLPDSPVVHASLGTVAQRPELLRIIVDGLAGEPYTIVLATGTQALLDGLGALPPNVIATPFVPHSLLLPRCDALLTHAGAGTLITGITHGLPLVLLPLFGDQPPNAACAAAAGAGIVLDPASVNASEVREAMRSVLTDPRYRESVTQIQREIDDLPPTRDAVSWLEELAS